MPYAGHPPTPPTGSAGSVGAVRGGRGGSTARVVLREPAREPGPAEEREHPDGDAGDADGRDRRDGADDDRRAVVADEGEQPPDAEEGRATGGGCGIGTEGHDDAGPEAVAHPMRSASAATPARVVVSGRVTSPMPRATETGTATQTR